MISCTMHYYQPLYGSIFHMMYIILSIPTFLLFFFSLPTFFYIIHHQYKIMMKLNIIHAFYLHNSKLSEANHIVQIVGNWFMCKWTD